MHPGWTWYATARCYVAGLSDLYDTPRYRVAGIVAALSQRRRWRQNCLAAEKLLKGENPGGLRLARVKAERILRGEDPTHVLSGPKIRAFYRALMGDDNAVVIDSWMARALGISEKMTPRQYERAAKQIEAEARALGRPPAIHQAIIWIDMRGEVN